MHDPGAWVTVIVWPAMVAVPVRWDVVVFAAMVSPTVPLPVPLDPEFTRIHGVPLAALHTHVLPVVTVTPVISPAAGDDFEVGAIVNVQAPVVVASATAWAVRGTASGALIVIIVSAAIAARPTRMFVSDASVSSSSSSQGEAHGPGCFVQESGRCNEMAK